MTWLSLIKPATNFFSSGIVSFCRNRIKSRISCLEMKVRLEDQAALKFCKWPIIRTYLVRQITWTIWWVHTREPPKPKCINQLLRAATFTQLLALTVPIQTTFQESQTYLEAVILRVLSLQAQQLKQTKMCTLIIRQISQTSPVFLSFHKCSLCNNNLTLISRTPIDSKEIKLTIITSRPQIISSILRRVAILKIEMGKMNLWFRESNRIQV